MARRAAPAKKAGPVKITIRVEGITGTVRKLQRAGLKLSDLDFRPIAAEVARYAVAFAPKRTGRLARSIKASKSSKRATISVGSARVPYAAAINYGWKKRSIAPSKFLNRAGKLAASHAPAELRRQAKVLIRQKGLA